MFAEEIALLLVTIIILYLKFELTIEVTLGYEL